MLRDENQMMDAQYRAFEQYKLDREYSFKEKELQLRERELANNRTKATSAHVTIIVAVLTILGALVASYLQGMASQRLEKLRLESELITKAVSFSDQVQNKKNLKFLLDAGFITDSGHKIKAKLEDSVFGLQLAMETKQLPDAFVWGNVADEYGHAVPETSIQLEDDAQMSAKTDLNGNYCLHLPFNAKMVRLKFTKHGYFTCRFCDTVTNEMRITLMFKRQPSSRQPPLPLKKYL